MIRRTGPDVLPRSMRRKSATAYSPGPANPSLHIFRAADSATFSPVLPTSITPFDRYIKPESPPSRLSSAQSCRVGRPAENPPTLRHPSASPPHAMLRSTLRSSRRAGSLLRLSQQQTAAFTTRPTVCGSLTAARATLALQKRNYAGPGVVCASKQSKQVACSLLLSASSTSFSAQLPRSRLLRILENPV